MGLPYLIADVFTDTPLAGNPLAVFPDAASLDGATMLRIAAEMNLSESIFVQPPSNPAHTAKVRIFTPARELPFAGHPTVGCAIVLARLKRFATPEGESSIVLEEGVGPVSVRVRILGGEPVFAQLTAAKAPELEAAPAAEVIARMLGLRVDELCGEAAVASCGNRFLCVELASREALSRCQADAQALTALHPSGTHGIYAWWPEGEGTRLHARMFGTGLGISEDPATGSAAASLGGLFGLRDARTEGLLQWEILQGVDMGRPSRLLLEVEKAGGEVRAVRVGGSAVVVAQGQLLV